MSLFKMTEVIKVINISKSFVLGLCSCDCNNKIKLRKSNGYLRKYKNGHNNKGKTGSDSTNWKNGIILVHNYLFIYKPDHPFANKQGYYPLHRYIYEQYYNCILLPYPIVDIHHINSNTFDNSIQNLQPLYHWQHSKIKKK